MTSEIRNAWKSISSIILVQRQALKKDGSWRTEIHYYISSLKNVKAKKMQQYIRSTAELKTVVTGFWTLFFEKTTTRQVSAMRLKTCQHCAAWR